MHDRLVANFARDAGSQPHWFWTPMSNTCGEDEMAYLRQFKRHSEEGVFGICYVVKSNDATLEERMAAIAGALGRNFVRARVEENPMVSARWPS